MTASTPTERLARRLFDTPNLEVALAHAVTVTRTAGGGARIGSTGHREHLLPVNLAASDARLALRGALRRACVAVLTAHAELDEKDRGRLPAHLAPGPRSASTRSCAAWLFDVALIVPGLVAPIAEGLLKAYRKADHALTAGAADPAPGPEIDEDARAVAAGHYVTAAEVEALTATTGERVKASTVRVWASRGKLTGREIDGRTVYRLSDVFTVAGRAA